MAPTAADFLNGLRRLWWIPFTALLLGVLLGALAASQTRSAATTTATVLFTFRVEDSGEQSAGSARRAEAEVAQARLDSYLELARTSQRVREVVDSAGVAPTSVGIQTATAGAGVAPPPGLVALSLDNGGLAQAEAAQFIAQLSAAVVGEVTAIDAQQETPSLRPEVLVGTPQVTPSAAGGMARAAVLVMVLVGLGFGAVYLQVWRQDRINTRRGIEERLGARVLADITGGPTDGAALALALGRGRQGTTTALLTPTGLPSRSAARASEAVAVAAPGLGLRVHVRAPGPAPTGSDPVDLILVDAAAHGLDADCLQSATTADIVGLVVEYGRTSYRELDAAGRILAEVTGADVAVIGVHPGPQSSG